MVVNKWKTIVVGTLAALGLISCGRVLSGSTPNVQEVPNGLINSTSKSWQEIDPGIEAMVMIKSGNGLLLVGESGVAKIDSINKATRYPPFVIRNEFTTKDGGVTNDRIMSKAANPGDAKSFPYLCTPENVALLSKKLLVLADCEHSKQLWTISPEKDSTYLDVVNFVSGDRIYLPSVLEVSGGRALIGINTKKEPILLAAETNIQNLKVIWKGNEGDGGIAAISFIDNYGWMLLGKGKILQSRDGGLTWTDLSTLSNIPMNDFINVTFRNSNEGYIVGSKGSLLRTDDGGKTWLSVKTPTTSDLRKVALEDESIVICCSDSKLMISDKRTGIWTTIDATGPVNDVLLINKTIYALINSKLHYIAQ